MTTQLPNQDTESARVIGPVPQLAVTRDQTNLVDASITKQLLDSTRTDTGYKCPRCDYSTPDPDAMIEHLADEINKAMEGLSRISLERPTRPQKVD
jgi:hypothetical protein